MDANKTNRVSPAFDKDKTVLTMNEVKPGSKMNTPEPPPSRPTTASEKMPLITLSWENMVVNLPDSKDTLLGKLQCWKPNVPGKKLINNVSGVVKPGTLMAIMGASGAGKTTLLNVINFRNRGSLKVKGTVKINGQPVQSSGAIASISGYVQQEDLFIGTLTVGEQLRFQASLKMSRDTSYKVRFERVEEVMNELNLKKCEKTMIGIPERDIKGISGGERRRLAFACELITNPNLMFFDEPTSGLDSYMARIIVECMKKLTAKGKTIICTIHQPSSDIFSMFDKLCLLAEGRIAYFGNLNESGKFFANMGYPVPQNYNPSDFYIQTLAIIPNEREECLKTVNAICDGFEKSHLNETLKNDVQEASNLVKDPNLNISLKSRNTYKANFCIQLKWLIWRTALSTVRDPMSMQIALAQTIIIAVLLGLIFLRLSYDQTGVQNMNGVLFILLTNTSFSNMFAVITTFTAEIPIFLREHLNGMYMVITYYLAKIIVEIPKFVILPIIFVSIVYWMCNLNNDVGRFFICVGVIILVANCSVAFGCFLSAIAPSTSAATALSGPLLVPLMIFSGFFLNNSSVPVYFLWLKYLSWFNYANEVLQINQWSNIDSLSCAGSSKCLYANGNDVLSYLQVNTSNFGIDLGAIAIILVGWRVLTFFVLLLKSYLK